MFQPTVKQMKEILEEEYQPSELLERELSQIESLRYKANTQVVNQAVGVSIELAKERDRRKYYEKQIQKALDRASWAGIMRSEIEKCKE